MVMGKARSCRRRAGARASRPALLPAFAAVLLGVAACSPVETWRDWTGAAKNDPNPATTPNSKNLAAGEASGYPNLATVPPPPSRAMTTAERDKLVQSLVADRANAKYTNEKLRAGFAETAAPVPPPPPPPVLSAAPPAEPNSGQAQAAAVAPPAPSTTPAKPPAPAATPAASPGAAPAASPGAGRTAGAAPAAAPTGPRKAGEPPQPGPMESSLEPPQIPVALPAPQQVQPPPPPPRQMTMPAAPQAPNTAAAAAHLPPPPAPAAMPAAIASAQFEPPPPPPVLAPPAARQTTAAAGPGKSASLGKSGGRGEGGAGTAAPAPTPAPAMTVALVNFAGDSTVLSETDRQALGKLVPLYRRHPGRVRIVGYAGVGSGAVEQLNGYRAALDRAQAVAAALGQAGIPADKILVEAAPMGTDSGQSRAEVLFEQ